MSKKPKHGTLDAKDEALWKQVTDTVRPLAHRPAAPHGGHDIQSQPAQALTRIERQDPKDIKTRSSAVPRFGLDRRTSRRLAAGREAVDRVIDLHGLTQEKAFAVLVRTIERSVRRDMKTVLVITGKGGKRFSQMGSGSAADRTRADFEQFEGILRRALPGWLEGEALRPLVESYGPAAPGHGGDGAFYVRLRRRKQGAAP